MSTFINYDYLIEGPAGAIAEANRVFVKFATENKDDYDTGFSLPTVTNETTEAVFYFYTTSYDMADDIQEEIRGLTAKEPHLRILLSDHTDDGRLSTYLNEIKAGMCRTSARGVAASASRTRGFCPILKRGVSRRTSRPPPRFSWNSICPAGATNRTRRPTWPLPANLSSATERPSRVWPLFRKRACREKPLPQLATASRKSAGSPDPEPTP